MEKPELPQSERMADMTIPEVEDLVREIALADGNESAGVRAIIGQYSTEPNVQRRLRQIAEDADTERRANLTIQRMNGLP